MLTDNINSIPNFILFTLLTLIIVSAFYFLIKESYRIKGGTVSKVGFGITIAITGILVLGVQIYMTKELFFTHDGGLFTSDINDNLLYNGIFLTPTIIIVFIFTIFLDKKLTIPLFIFLIIGQYYSVIYDNFHQIDESPATGDWLYLFYSIIEYILCILALFFVDRFNFIKKNGFKFIILIVFYIVIHFAISFFYQITIFDLLDSDKVDLINEDWFTFANLTALKSIESTYVILCSVFVLILVLLVDKLYNNFSALETFSTKDDISYYKMSLSQDNLVKMIDDNKINFGSLVLFRIDSESDSKKSNVLNKIRLYTEYKYENSFFFKVSAQFYGAFYSLSEHYNLSESLDNNKEDKRTERDELKDIADELDKISEEEFVDISATCSIYGIHSYSIPELIDQAKFLMSPIVHRSNQNTIIVYDFKRVKERLNETAQVRGLMIDADTLSISFTRALSSEGIFYPNISFKGEKVSLFDVIDGENVSEDQIDTLLRFTSYQTLRHFKNDKNKLIIYYSGIHMDSILFRLKDFEKKVSRHIDAKKLILGIDTSLTSMGKEFQKNLKELRKFGIKVAAINPQSIDQEQADLLKPDYILDPNTNVNPLRIKKHKLKIKTDALIISPNIDN